MLEELIRRYFPKKWQRNRRVSVIFAVVMKKISRNIIVLCVALTTALSAYSQDSIAANPDDEPIDIELARMPVRRPDHAVPTIVTLRGEAAIARFAELAVVPEKQEESKRVIVQGNAAVSSALQAQRTQRKQTQEEIDANVEKYIAEAPKTRDLSTLWQCHPSHLRRGTHDPRPAACLIRCQASPWRYGV